MSFRMIMETACQKGTFGTRSHEGFLNQPRMNVRKAINLAIFKKISDLFHSGTKVAFCSANEWCGCQNSPLHDREVC